MRLLLLLPLVLLSFTSRSQSGTWELWSNTKDINTIETDGNNIWLGTTGGLVLLDKISGDLQLFNSCNSGLPQSNVLQIIVDDLHRVWMISQDLYGEEDMAISMYDGTSWTEITEYPEPWENYSGGERKFAIDHNLVLWAIAGYQLYQFNGSEWQVADDEMLGFEPESVRSLNRSSSGDLLLTSYNQNTGEPFFSIYNGQAWNTIVTTGVPVISQTVLYDAVMDDSGKLYAWNDNQEIFLFDGQNWTVIHFPYTYYIYNIVPEHNGTSIWIKASHRLIKYDGGTFYEMDTSYQAPYESWVTALAIDEDDEIWWATPVSVIAYNHTDSIFYSANTAELFYTPLLTTNILHEALLANKNGFQIFKGSYFATLSPDTSLLYYNAGHNNTADTYYLQGDNGIFNKYKNGNWTSFTAAPDLSSYDVNNLLRIDADQLGNLMEYRIYYDNWSPYSKGETYWNMFFYDENQDIWTDPDCKTLENYTLDGQNNFYWVSGGVEDKIYKYDHFNNTLINNELYGISGNIGPIIIDNSNALWVCSESGLTKITDNSHQTFDIAELDVNTSYVFDLFVDHDNHLYAATDDGIVYFDGNNVNVINRTNSNIPSNIVTKVIADKFNNLWITTISGIGFCANCGFSSIVGIENIHEDMSVQIFPNPAHDAFVFQFNLPESSETSIGLFDVSGKNVTTFFNGNLSKGDHSLNFATDLLTKGLYLLKLKTDNVVITKKLVVD